LIVGKELLTVLCAPYKRVSLTYLAKEINVGVDKVEVYMQELILDQKLDGKLDLINGYFENNDFTRDEKDRERIAKDKEKNEALELWIKTFINSNAI